jgi:hypothetical protein
MSEDIENQLRRVMRPVEPPAGFTERVMRALPERGSRATLPPVAVLHAAPRTSLWRRLSAPAALAASFAVAIVMGNYVGQRQAERERLAGLEASRAFMEALRVTSRKLDQAYQAVNRPPPVPPAVEENRS